MRILTTTGLSLLFASRWAGDKEISLESSVFNTSADANWQIVDGSPGISMIGLSGGRTSTPPSLPWAVSDGVNPVRAMQCTRTGGKKRPATVWLEPTDSWPA